MRLPCNRKNTRATVGVDKVHARSLYVDEYLTRAGFWSLDLTDLEGGPLGHIVQGILQIRWECARGTMQDRSDRRG